MKEISTTNGKIYFDEFTRYYYKSANTKLKKGIFENYDGYLSYIQQINYFDTIYYNITKKCNMHCSYCYSHNEDVNINKEQNDIILRKLLQLNCHSIALIGGEPMCNSNFWEILESIKSIPNISEITIVTNGTLIGKQNISLLKDPRICLQISLDDINEEDNAKTRGYGQLTKVFDILPDLIQAKVNIRMMKVLTRESIKTSERFYRFFHQQGIPVGFFIVKKVTDDIKPTVDQLRRLLDFLKNQYNIDVTEAFEIVKFADNMMFGNEGFPITHCGAGITSLSIHPDGNVYPCVKRYRETDLITNIFNEAAVYDILNHRKELIKKDLVDNNKHCQKCDLKYFCGGGCRAEATNNLPCKYNCSYYKFALEYYGEKVYNQS